MKQTKEINYRRRSAIYVFKALLLFFLFVACSNPNNNTYIYDTGWPPSSVTYLGYGVWADGNITAGTGAAWGLIIH